jgi:hypothetical protein
VLAGLLIEPRKVPLGIVFGWLLGIVNFRQLSRNIRGLIGAEKATLRLVIMSMTRLIAVMIIIALLIFYRVVNVFGLLFGFTVVFVLILSEGTRLSKTGKEERS